MEATVKHGQADKHGESRDKQEETGANHFIYRRRASRCGGTFKHYHPSR